MYRQTDRQTDVITLCVVSVRLTQAYPNKFRITSAGMLYSWKLLWELNLVFFCDCRKFSQILYG